MITKLMNSKNLIIVVSIIVGVAVLFGVGYLLGVLSERGKTGPQIESLEKITGITSSLSSSKLILSIIAYGKVTNISGRTITLAMGIETMQITIRQDAQIYSYTTPTAVQGKVPEFPAQIPAEFKDIKIGNNLNINAKMLPDGQLEGLSAIILPATMKISQ